ncbi:GNAT family N-acetyltransferase [Extibacter muris]|nr:GNAT family N-acetyltransferase [Extibacter muris]MCU0079807.1 GNAT family N-acetyltransferase [Extibacter muris]
MPDMNQEVEIGYGLGKEFEHSGYMPEAVQAMCKWALEQENVAQDKLDSLEDYRSYIEAEVDAISFRMGLCRKKDWAALYTASIDFIDIYTTAVARSTCLRLSIGRT